MTGPVSFCPRCGRIVGTSHSQPECSAYYDAAYRAASNWKDPAFLHARWHRALDDPSREPNPIGAHILQVLADAWDAGWLEGADDQKRWNKHNEPWTGPAPNPYRARLAERDPTRSGSGR